MCWCRKLPEPFHDRTKWFFDKWTSVNLGWIRKEGIPKIFVFLSLVRSAPEGEITHRTANQWQFTVRAARVEDSERIAAHGLRGVSEIFSSIGFVKWLSVNFDIRERFLFNWIISFRSYVRSEGWIVPNKRTARGQKPNEMNAGMCHKKFQSIDSCNWTQEF